MPVRMEPAPVPARILAGAVDVALVMAPVSALVAAPARWPDHPIVHRADRTHRADRADRAMKAMSDPGVARNLARSWHLVALPARNRRSPGRRLVGIRTVDARTGGPVTLCSALVAQLLRLIQEELSRRASAPWLRRHERRHRALPERIEEVRRVHAADPEAAARATRALHREDAVSCLPFVCVMLVVGLPVPLSALLSPRRQTIVERLARIAVVRDRQ